jgi:hypothetical protein
MTDATHLQQSLAELRAEIEALGTGHTEARLRLEALIHDIETRLGDPKTAAADATLGYRLKTSILAFEVSHPRLAAVMNDLVEKLSDMGI